MILGVDGMRSLRLATDCSGQDKTMSFICDLLCNVIEQLGSDNKNQEPDCPYSRSLPGSRYKVSGVTCSVSVCENCWSIEGWIQSKRRNKLHQTLVEKLVRPHTNLVLRESLDDVLHHLLPWDIELGIDDPIEESEEERSLSVYKTFFSVAYD